MAMDEDRTPEMSGQEATNGDGSSHDSRAGRAGGWEVAAGVWGLALIVLVAGVSVWLAGPPTPLSEDAELDEFAAGRALRDVAELSREPRPIGSAAHRTAREYLIGRMTELGLAPEVQETTVVWRQGEDRIRAARVHNLVGRRAGVGESGAVLLLAHYDSRPNSPGAGDDASGVAVALESVRALTQGEPLARDLIVLFTDGEELALLGARGFVAEHPWSAEAEIVLNFEARGSRGPASMFETAAGDLELVRAFAAAAPHPTASSLNAEVYARMPNDTDFSAFRAVGRSGLSFAFVGGLDSYHTALDTIDRLDPASLQHAGANAVALIRHLDGGATPPRGAEGAYFNPLGGWLVVLPAGTVLPLAATLAVLAVALAVLAIRRRRLEWRAVIRGSLLCVAVLALAPLAAAAVWKLFADNAAALLATPHGLPHRLELTGLALLLAGLASVSALGSLSPRLSPTEAALGVGGTWAILALVTAVFVPGASFLFWWPLVWLLIGAAAVVLGDLRPRAAILVLTVGALPGVAMLAPLAILVFQALTPHLAVAAMALPTMALALGLPALLSAGAGRQRLALTALMACLVLLAVSVWGAPDRQRPGTADLVHLQELDEGFGFWLSRDEWLHPWVAGELGNEAEQWQAPGFIDAEGEWISRGGRQPADAEGPKVAVIEDQRLDGRRLTVRVGSPAGAPMLHVEAFSTVQITALELAGRRFERAGEEATRPLRLELAGFAPEGVEMSFELPGRWPVELHVSEQFYGLPEGPSRPPELIPAGSWTSHSRLVHRSFLR